MPTLRIDDLEVTVPEGSTVLDAARELGIEIPTLCELPGFEARTSCLVCLVAVEGESRLVPSCAYPAREGLKVESETDEVREARRTSLELLLSDHVGDCMAPCQRTCPLHMNIPVMLRHLVANEWDEAARVVREGIPLAGVAGRLCHHPCEAGCRRGRHDGAVRIRDLVRRVAELGFVPERGPRRTQRVAIVGSGPTGLSAASQLLRYGFTCTVFEAHDEPGGSLRRAVPEEQLPRAVVDDEIELIGSLGAQFQLRTRVGEHISLAELRADFGAVFVACGATSARQAQALGLDADEGRVETDRNTFATSQEGVFAGGGATRGEARIERVMADGKEAACAIRQYLAGQPITVSRSRSVSAMGRLSEDELRAFVAQEGVNSAARTDLGADAHENEVREEARRCLHCDCRKRDTCALRKWSEAYGANRLRFHRQRKPFEQVADHPLIIYESGKCIACGRCVAIAEAAGEELGLTFVGRGFPIRVAVPFEEPLSAGLRNTAVECAEACPTAALCLKENDVNSGDRRT